MRRIAAVSTILVALVVVPAPGGAVASRGLAERWVVRDFGPKSDRSAGIALSPDGATLYVAATSGDRAAVAAHDTATGETRWAVRIRPRHDLAEFAQAVALSPDGTLVFVTLQAEEASDTRSIVTVALDAAAGAVVWRTRTSVGAQRQAIPVAIAVSPGGDGVYVVAATTGTGGIDDFWDYTTVAYDASSGAKRWTQTYGGPARGADIPAGVVVSTDGARVYVTGTSIGRATLRDYATVAYGAGHGGRLWAARNGTDGDDYAAGLAVSPDGARVYVAGTVRGFSGSADYRTVALDAVSGARIRGFRFDSGLADRALAIAVDPDGSRFYVTGLGGGDFATVASSADGIVPLWVARYGNPGLTDAASAVAAAAGRVYVTGRSDNGIYSCEGEVSGSEYATVGYDAMTGSELWSATYSGNRRRDPDSATAVAVTPDGTSVFVSGTSDDGCRVTPDVATVSYGP
jgi:DNA-binding beta-propeller fold protein YncE